MGRIKSVKIVDQIIEAYVIEDLTSGCWEWTGGHHKQGYPMCRFDGQMHIAARLFKEDKIGKTLKHAERVVNQCGNVNCVNPDHYEIATKGSEFWRKGGSDYRFTQEEADALKAEWDSIEPYYGKRRDFKNKYKISDLMMPKITKGTYKSKKEK